MFTIDFADSSNTTLVPEGHYETIIDKYLIDDRRLTLYLVVRNDVEQGSQNRVLFLDLWKKREPNEADKSVDGFSFAQLMSIARNAGLKNGTQRNSLEDFLNSLCGKCLFVNVTHSEYNGKPQIKINPVTDIMPTNVPDCKHKRREKQVSTDSDGWTSLPTKDDVPF